MTLYEHVCAYFKRQEKARLRLLWTDALLPSARKIAWHARGQDDAAMYMVCPPDMQDRIDRGIAPTVEDVRLAEEVAATYLAASCAEKSRMRRVHGRQRGENFHVR